MTANDSRTLTVILVHGKYPSGNRGRRTGKGREIMLQVRLRMRARKWDRSGRSGDTVTVDEENNLAQNSMHLFLSFY